MAILNQGIRNANDGLSALQIKDGALNNISTLLDRLATLATQASSSPATASTSASWRTNTTRCSTEIDREATVAGLDDDTDFSVFVSNEATAADGVVTGTIGAADTTALSPDHGLAGPTRPTRRRR